MWDEHLRGRQVGIETGRRGHEPGRPYVLMIHGSGGTAQNWLGQLSGLSKELNVAAIDLPGHGGTPGPSMGKVEDYTSWLADFIKDGPVRPILMGHSLGGAVAQLTALEHPDLLSGLILVGTGSRLRVLPAILEGVLADFKATVKIIMKYAYSENADARLLEQGEQRMLEGAPEVLHGDFTACNLFDVGPRLGEIRLPTLMVVGKSDKLTPPKYSRFLQEGIAGSRTVEIENAGHMVFVEQPAEFNRVVTDFCKGI